MHRESDRHGPREDDELKSELQGMLKGNRPSRAEEWRDPEPPADDDYTVPPIDEHEEPER
ncbi:hypothetical protein [Prauserella muralis]|uniref:Uncharacterized protein n=1 Tax=Prauserella muralis TaxID=588067 RepID=A0A2V4B0Q9_9PSEU|nr:hypothetical protein [Prauserella muralis]PXY26958.1 hypothetical protein BAY60_10680 [Prauserella muralis]TWE23427.1 hypothetical protein FHX69_4691 [Prauserella muralis]